MKEFRELIDVVMLEQIEESHLSLFVENMRKRGCKDSTINLHLRVLKSCLNSARRFYPKFYWFPPRLENAVRKAERIEPEVTVEMIDKIIDTLKEMNTLRSLDVADMVLISSQTALRIGEVISLKWINISLISGIRSPHGRLTFISEKTKVVSQIPITKSIKSILMSRFQSKGNQEQVFNWNIQFNSMRVAVEELFKEACKRANILYGRDILGGIRFHSLRHFVARSLLDAGLDLATVGAFGRWNQRSMVMLYGKATPTTVDLSRKVMERLFEGSNSSEDKELEEVVS